MQGWQLMASLFQSHFRGYPHMYTFFKVYLLVVWSVTKNNQVNLFLRRKATRKLVNWEKSQLEKVKPEEKYAE